MTDEELNKIVDLVVAKIASKLQSMPIQPIIPQPGYLPPGISPFPPNPVVPHWYWADPTLHPVTSVNPNISTTGGISSVGIMDQGIN